MSPTLRHFMLISVLGVATLIAALLYFHMDLGRDYLDEQLATHNRNLAAVLRDSLLGGGLEQALRDAPTALSPALHDKIATTLHNELRWVPVVKVKVYSPTGIVLFSTVDDEIGKDASGNSAVQRAVAGEAVSDLVKRDHLNELDGSVETIDLHQQYIPIKDSVNGGVLGAFEVYTDVARILQHVSGKQRNAFWSIGGMLGIFYLALTLQFLKTHRSLLTEQQAREAHLEELETIKAELERRVELRTAELEKSQVFLQSVIDGIGNPLLVIRPDYTIALMNQSARRLVPDDPEVQRRPLCYQISHRRNTPCDGIDHPCAFAQVMKHGRAARVRHTHYDPEDDQPLIIDLISTPLYSADGVFEGVIEVEHDVTQLVRMQAGLVESEARLQAIMAHVPDAIFTCDADCITRSANPSARKLLNAREGDLIGVPLTELLRDPSQVGGAFCGRDLTVQREVDMRRIDGTEFPAEVWVGPVVLEGETSYIAVVRDITARRMAQDELDKTRRQYFHQEKMAAIGQLAAGILHEVGNPIAAIAGATAELKTIGAQGCDDVDDCPIDGALERNIDLIDQQTTRLARITREIADFASPRPRERELLDLNSLLRSTARLLSYDRRFRDVRLDLDLDHELPAIVGVADQLTQVFMNLLINAMDACNGEREPTLESTARILISSAIEGEWVEVTINDNGCGMSETTVARAMEPFYTTKPVGKGTGLGLSLCDSIAAAHGGLLRIESVEGEGTTIHLMLPIDAEADEKDRVEAHS